MTSSSILDPETDPQYQPVLRRLRALLHRYGCPEPMTLQDYVTRQLDGIAHAGVQLHIEECLTCREEVALLYEATQPEPAPAASPESLMARAARTLRAVLALDAPQWVLRGEGDAHVLYRIEGSDWEVRLTRGLDAQGRTLAGQLLGPDDAELAGATAHLLSEGDLLTSAPLDDTGEFELHHRSGGPLTLEIVVADRVIELNL